MDTGRGTEGFRIAALVAIILLTAFTILSLGPVLGSYWPLMFVVQAVSTVGVLRMSSVKKALPGEERESFSTLEVAVRFLILILGFGPVLLPLVGSLIGGIFDCYSTEHGTYQRGISMDVRGCRASTVELGALLNWLHLTSLMLIITWPFLLIGSWLLVVLAWKHWGTSRARQ